MGGVGGGGGFTSLMLVVDQDIFGIVPQAKFQYLQSRAFVCSFMEKLRLMGKAILSLLSKKSNLPPSSLVLTTMLRQAGILS